MLGWSFNARTADEIAALIRAMEQHRYLKEVDHRIHWSIDLALEPLGGSFAEHATTNDDLDCNLDLGSREPRLWRSASCTDVAAALDALWSPNGGKSRERLARALRDANIPRPNHKPWQSDPDEAPFPELIVLDWVLLPVDELDTERHLGALRAMENSEEEVDASEPVYVEGTPLSEAELCNGASKGIVPCAWMLWAEGPYSYCSYLFRGIARAAKLVDPPIGYRDI